MMRQKRGGLAGLREHVRPIESGFENKAQRRANRRNSRILVLPDRKEQLRNSEPFVRARTVSGKPRGEVR